MASFPSLGRLALFVGCGWFWGLVDAPSLPPTHPYATKATNTGQLIRTHAPVDEHVLVDLVAAVDEHPVGHLPQQGGGHARVQGPEVQLLSVWVGGGFRGGIGLDRRAVELLSVLLGGLGGGDRVRVLAFLGGGIGVCGEWV